MTTWEQENETQKKDEPEIPGSLVDKWVKVLIFKGPYFNYKSVGTLSNTNSKQEKIWSARPFQDQKLFL